jgi:hypothetical protein
MICRPLRKSTYHRSFSPVRLFLFLIVLVLNRSADGKILRVIGNDLQRVIGNVLDVSKLSSGFVKVESLSFTLREVCEVSTSSSSCDRHPRSV